MIDFPSGHDASAIQQATARQSVNAGLSGVPVTNRQKGAGFNWNWLATNITPQRFAKHLRLILVNPSEAGIDPASPMADTNKAATPMSPVSWDGEMSASAPTISRTV